MVVVRHGHGRLARRHLVPCGGAVRNSELQRPQQILCGLLEAAPGPAPEQQVEHRPAGVAVGEPARLVHEGQNGCAPDKLLERLPGIRQQVRTAGRLSELIDRGVSGHIPAPAWAMQDASRSSCPRRAASRTTSPTSDLVMKPAWKVVSGVTGAWSSTSTTPAQTTSRSGPRRNTDLRTRHRPPLQLLGRAVRATRRRPSTQLGPPIGAARGKPRRDRHDARSWRT